ncbi:unnamed protein product [Haemonchus placei]|uniref:Uncharacterized protein n=1 Tax=Haemonchus placei TaxID=6290 RepID=A0A0N4WJ24_HAEPC|nr:unnamed protein product [Haemonchus placei]
MGERGSGLREMGVRVGADFVEELELECPIRMNDGRLGQVHDRKTTSETCALLPKTTSDPIDRPDIPGPNRPSQPL